MFFCRAESMNRLSWGEFYLLLRFVFVGLAPILA
jgi:hypothetical protein